ncbi:uncharacterized protein G2W53_004941 [Senna tora]|uniref:Uncharacterized protein n=1 Tax=Senna tora TaxID=362788 RepID=A0A834XDP3_9FABA|nr:uncharacterized protein G2W53_004941 [Senna tora]
MDVLAAYPYRAMGQGDGWTVDYRPIV